MTSLPLISKDTPPPLNASKWIKCQVLLETDEVANLLQSLGDFHLYRTGRVIKSGEEELKPEDFLQTYEHYVSFLRKGELPEEADFTTAMTAEKDALYAIPINEDKRLIKLKRPVIQIQSHRMGYSSIDGKFRPMVFGNDSIFWGLQFSYPQICEDPVTKKILNVNDISQFPNTKLFREIQRWMRPNTIPTPFEVNGEKTNVPMRLGKQCFQWISQHPQLINYHINVRVKKHEH